MDGEKEKTRAGMSAQTSMESTTATIGGHLSGNATDTTANAHHNVWGSSDINDRGESLLDFILSTNLYIANVEYSVSLARMTR